MIDRAPMRTPRLGIGVAPPAATVATQDIKSLRDVATLGSELVTNGGFTGGVAGWTLGANWAYGANNVVHTAGAVEALSQDISVVSGTVYVISFSQSAATAGSLTIAIGAVSVDWAYWQSVKSVTITAGATGALSFSITPTTDYDGTLDDISVKAIVAYTLPVARLLNADGSIGAEIRSGGSGLSNTAIGLNALYANTTGNYNTAIGRDALRSNTTGTTSNTAIGHYALNSNTTGNYNTAIGRDALYSNTTGYYNTAIGVYALRSNTTGTSNTAIGVNALRSNTTGTSNTAIGVNALNSNTTGYYNTAIGYYALYANTTGNYNTAIGLNALYANTTGNYNTAIGRDALRSNTTGTLLEHHGLLQHRDRGLRALRRNRRCREHRVGIPGREPDHHGQLQHHYRVRYRPTARHDEQLRQHWRNPERDERSQRRNGSARVLRDRADQQAERGPERRYSVRFGEPDNSVDQLRTDHHHTVTMREIKWTSKNIHERKRLRL